MSANGGVILDVLGTLVSHGHLGHRNKVMK